MAVVVDLDAPRRLGETEALGEAGEQRLLGGRDREFATEGVARVGKRVVDQVLLLAALGHADADAPTHALAERLLQQRALLDLVGEQDQLRRRLVVVELGEEGAEHLAGLERLVGAREIGAVAPVLPGAEEEHLDAGLAALLMDGEDVGLVDRLRVDALVGLDVGERGEAVAVARGGLEIERSDAAAMSFWISPRTAWLRPERKSFASLTRSA